MGKVICQLVPYVCIPCFVKIFGELEPIQEKLSIKHDKCLVCAKKVWVVNVKAWGFSPLTFMADNSDEKP